MNAWKNCKESFIHLRCAEGLESRLESVWRDRELECAPTTLLSVRELRKAKVANALNHLKSF